MHPHSRRKTALRAYNRRMIKMQRSESSCFEFSGSLRPGRRESGDGAADGPPAGESVAVRRAKLCPAWVRLGTGLLLAVSSLVAQQNRVPSLVDTGRTVTLKGNRNPQAVPERSEERRVGKECRSRWS